MKVPGQDWTEEQGDVQGELAGQPCGDWLLTVKLMTGKGRLWDPGLKE